MVEKIDDDLTVAHQNRRVPQRFDIMTAITQSIENWPIPELTELLARIQRWFWPIEITTPPDPHDTLQSSLKKLSRVADLIELMLVKHLDDHIGEPDGIDIVQQPLLEKLTANEPAMSSNLAGFWREIAIPTIVTNIKPGIYRIHWKGAPKRPQFTSIATIGITESGKRWIARADWLSSNSLDAEMMLKISRMDALQDRDVSDDPATKVGDDHER